MTGIKNWTVTFSERNWVFEECLRSMNIGYLTKNRVDVLQYRYGCSLKDYQKIQVLYQAKRRQAWG